MNQVSPVAYAQDKVAILERQVRDLTQINRALIESMKWHLQGSPEKAKECLAVGNRQLVKLMLAAD